MKRNNKKSKNSLYVTITVVICIIIICVFLFFRPYAPQKNNYVDVGIILSQEKDYSTGNYNWTITLTGHSSSNVFIKTDEVKCYLKNEEGNNVINGEYIKGLKGDITYNDNDNDGYLSGNDTFYILGEPYGLARNNFRFSLIYEKCVPSRPMMCNDLRLE